MSKKNIIILVVILVVIAAGLFVWKGGFMSQKTWPAADINSESGIMGNIGDKITGGIMGPGKKITDDLYIEMMIEVLKIQSDKNPAVYALEVESLYKKYGVTEESLEAYAKELENNPQRAMELAQKYSERFAEIQGLAQ